MFAFKGDKENGVRQPARLWARPRASLKSRLRLRWFSGVLAIFTVLLALTAASWAGLQSLERALFSGNDLFRIRNVKIECTGEKLTKKHIMDYAKLEGCDNIFAVDIAAKREYLLKQVPRVESVVITRRLPGDLVIEVRERQSVACLEMDGYYLTIDRAGYVLGASAALPHLPAIGGHAMPGIRPGVSLAGTAVMNALEVVDVCETADFRDAVKVRRLDLRGRDSLTLGLSGGERIILAWDRMGAHDDLARTNLKNKLSQLAAILRKCEQSGRRLDLLDMTLDNNFPAPAQH